MKIGWSATYLRLIAGEDRSHTTAEDPIGRLSQIAQSNTDAYYEKLENNSKIILDALKTVTQPM